jgi:hypothetical protein
MPMPVQAVAAPRPIPWNMIAFLGRLIGFVLLFVGVLLMIIGATPLGGCYTSAGSCVGNTTWMSGVANYIVTAKILFALGLFFLGAGAGIKLHWGLPMPTTGRPEELAYVAADRRANHFIVALTVFLMLVLLLTIGTPVVP